ncbi:hypothetical protein RQP46_002319 [Phenoliferia psychrophenolica]
MYRQPVNQSILEPEMSASPERSPGQPKIASFTPELIDEILHHLAVDLRVDPYDSPTEYPGPKTIENYALVSRNWRGPVQRRLMSRLVIKSGTQAQQVAEGFVASGLDAYVKDLKIQFAEHLWKAPNDIVDEPTSDQIASVDGVTRDHFLALLPHFPALTKLDLDGPLFTQFEPSDIIKLQASPSLSRLTSLRIFTRRWLRDVDLAPVYDILILTPSLTTLSLKSYESETLELEGATASSMLNLGVLSTDTIARVKELFCTAHQLLVNNFASRSPSLKVVKLDADFWCYEEHEDDREYAEMERNQFKELVDTLKDTGVEFVVTGEGLREALEEMG